jgi:uncharacterized membrane protein YhaH (DUF805 family)
MDFGFVFFRPDGRLSPRRFGQGLILLTGAMMIITIAASLVAEGFSLLQWTLIFPYICLFSKRLHDAGYSGWFYLLFLISYLVLISALTFMLIGWLSPGAAVMQAEYFEIAMRDGPMKGLEWMQINGAELARLSVATNVLALLISQAILGLVAAKLPSFPNANRYGPPTTGPYAPDA